MDASEKKGDAVADYSMKSDLHEKTGDMKFTFGFPAGPDNNESRKITKVRKGMGKAKYSSLITTIPAEMCKALGITPGDSIMWSHTKGKNMMMVMRVDPMLTEHTSLAYYLLDKMETKSMNKEDKDVLQAVKSMLKEIGPSSKLSKEQVENELRKWADKKKAEKKDGV